MGGRPRYWLRRPIGTSDAHRAVADNPVPSPWILRQQNALLVSLVYLFGLFAIIFAGGLFSVFRFIRNRRCRLGDGFFILSQGHSPKRNAPEEHEAKDNGRGGSGDRRLVFHDGRILGQLRDRFVRRLVIIPAQHRLNILFASQRQLPVTSQLLDLPSTRLRQQFQHRLHRLRIQLLRTGRHLRVVEPRVVGLVVGPLDLRMQPLLVELV